MTHKKYLLFNLLQLQDIVRDLTELQQHLHGQDIQKLDAAISKIQYAIIDFGDISELRNTGD